MNQADEQQNYTSPEGWFEVLLPPGWMAEMEGESTTMFYDPQGPGGTLRIGALAIAGPEGEPANMVAVLQEKWKGVPQPANFFRNFSDSAGAVRYDLERDEDGTLLHQRFWELAQRNLLLVFSYTHEARQWESEGVQKELEIATGVVASVQFLR